METAERNGPRGARRLWQRARGLLYFRKPPNAKRALRLTLRAARAGCADAQAAWARWHSQGLHGCPQDEERARRWLRLAARRGSRQADSLLRLRGD